MTVAEQLTQVRASADAPLERFGRDRAATERFDGARARTSVVVYERVLPALPLSARRIRKECDSVLKVLGVDVRRRQDIALAVSEAASNVVLHAYLGVAPGPIDVDAVVRGRDVVIAVVDDGSGMRPRKDSPGLGAGLSVMKQVCDELRVLSGVGGRGTHVRMTFGDAAPALTAPTRSRAVQTTVRARDEAGTLRDYVDALRAGASALHDESSAVVAQARRAVAYSAERRDARRSRAARAAHDGQADGQPAAPG